jgi:hypothetical protein
MTLEQLQEIFAVQLGNPDIYYMIQTSTDISVCKHDMALHTLDDLLPTLSSLTYDPTQGTYPLFKKDTV